MIVDAVRLEEEMLGRYFKQKSIASFLRQVGDAPTKLGTLTRLVKNKYSFCVKVASTAADVPVEAVHVYVELISAAALIPLNL